MKNKSPTVPRKVSEELGELINSFVMLCPDRLFADRNCPFKLHLPEINDKVPSTVAFPANLVSLALFIIKLKHVVFDGMVWLAEPSNVIVPVALPVLKFIPAGKGSGSVLCVRMVPLCVAVVILPIILLVPIFNVPPATDV